MGGRLLKAHAQMASYGSLDKVEHENPEGDFFKGWMALREVNDSQ